MNRLVACFVVGVVGSWSSVARADQLVVPNEFPTIGAAIAAASSGDEIVVKKGTYQENLTITTNDLRLVAQGKVRLVGDGSGTGLVLGAVADCHVIGFEFRDFDIGILVSLSDDIEISECRFVDISGPAIDFNAIAGRVNDCEIERALHGIYATSSSAIEIRRNRFSECLINAITVEGVGITISKNVIERCGNVGIQIGKPDKGVSQATHVIVEKNKISRVESFLMTKGGTERAGIDVDYNSIDVTLIGNTIKDVDGKGIRIGNACTQPVVHANKIQTTTGAGIEVAAAGTTVSENKVRESGASGIHTIGVGAAGSYVLANDVKGCAESGIRLGSSFGFAVWNKVRDSGNGSITEDIQGSNYIAENDTDD